MLKRILIIDDDKDVCEVLSKNLTHDGYEAVYAFSGASGIEKTQEGKFDIIILDLKLPDMYGTDVLKQIQNNGQDIPVIILTGYPSLDSAIETFRNNGVDYLRKPFNINELRTTLTKALTAKPRIPKKKLTEIKNVGEKFKELRKSKRMSLDILADKTDLSKSFLSEMERARRFPRLDTLQKIARALDVDVHFFFNQ